MSRHLFDYNSILIGNISIRQKRITEKNCISQAVQITGKTICVPEYSIFNEEKGAFYPGWNLSLPVVTDGNVTTPLKMNISSDLMNAFVFKKAKELKSYSHTGTYTTYSGGGYHIFLNNQNNDVLEKLQLMKWIDEKTRAVFIEFALMNVNIDSFMYGVILFEFLPSGNVIKSFTLNPLNLSTEAIYNMASMSNLCNMIYLAFTIVFILKKVHKALKKEGWSHFKQFWNYVDWAIIVFSICKRNLLIYFTICKRFLIKIILYTRYHCHYFIYFT